jgi:hypothetical protein
MKINAGQQDNKKFFRPRKDIGISDVNINFLFFFRGVGNVYLKGSLDLIDGEDC